MAFLATAHVALFGWLWPLPAAYLRRCSTGISIFLGSLLHLWLYSHSFRHWPLKGYIFCLSTLSFEIQVEASLNPQLLHSVWLKKQYDVENGPGVLTVRTISTPMVTATILSTLDGWNCRRLNLKNTSLGYTKWAGHCGTFLSSKVFQRNSFFYTLEPGNYGLCPIPKMPSSHLFYCLHAKYSISL